MNTNGSYTFNFTILEVADLLNLEVRHRGGKSIDVDCPLCGKKGKMNLKPLLSRVKCVCLQNLNKKIGVLYKKSDADTFRQSVQKVFSFFASNLLENYSKI